MKSPTDGSKGMSAVLRADAGGSCSSASKRSASRRSAVALLTIPTAMHASLHTLRQAHRCHEK